MRRQQKTTRVGRREEDKVEPEDNPGAPSLVKLNIAMMTDGQRTVCQLPSNRRIPNGTYGGVGGRWG
jgi:hypothetical protein